MTVPRPTPTDAEHVTEQFRVIAQVLARQLSRVDIGAKAAQVAAVTADVFADKVTSLLRRLRTASAGDSLARLTDVSATLCELTGAAAWWISSVNTETGTIFALRCGTPRTAGHSDGQWPTVVVDPTPYRLADYPATAAIIAGGSFSVDTMNGEPAERRAWSTRGASGARCSTA